MDLKTRKFINNTKPKFGNGADAFTINPVLGYDPNKYYFGGGMPTFTPNGGEPVSAIDQFSSMSQGQKLANKNAQNAIDPNKLNPTDTQKSPINGAGIVDAAILTLNFGATLSNTHKYNKTAGQILSEGNTSSGSIGGHGFTRYSIDEDAQRKELSAQNKLDTMSNITSGMAAGAAVGTLFGPGIGTAIGGGVGGLIGGVASIFGSNSAEEEMEHLLAVAKADAKIKSGVSLADVRSKSLQDQEIRAYNGKDAIPRYLRGKDVNTSIGVVNGSLNAWVSKGEYIWDGQGNLSRVNRGPNDSAPAFLTGKDTVFTNNPRIPAPKGFRTIAEAVPYAAATGLLGSLAAHQKRMHDIGYYNGKDSMRKYEKGKLGWLPNVLTSGLGVLAGWNQYNEARNSAIKNPNTYEANPYEGAALNQLRGLNIDGTPIMRNILDTERRSIGDIMRMGGTTGAERMRAILAASYGSKKAYADAIPQIQAQNNAYKSAYANAMLNAGQNTAQRRLQARQWNEYYYAKAHAARQQDMQQGMYNILNNINKFYSNEFERDQFNKMYNLYAQDVENNKPQVKSNKKPVAKTTLPSQNTAWRPTPNLITWKAPEVPTSSLLIGSKSSPVITQQPYPTYAQWASSTPQNSWIDSIMNKYGISR